MCCTNGRELWIIILFPICRWNYDNIWSEYYRHNLVLQDFNWIRPQLQCTLELRNKKCNFLDSTISRNGKELEFGIYRKCTYSDAIIPFNPCHPLQYKLATLRFLINTLKIYQLCNETVKQEILRIKNNLHNKKNFQFYWSTFFRLT